MCVLLVLRHLVRHCTRARPYPRTPRCGPHPCVCGSVRIVPAAAAARTVLVLATAAECAPGMRSSRDKQLCHLDTAVAGMGGSAGTVAGLAAHPLPCGESARVVARLGGDRGLRQHVPVQFRSVADSGGGNVHAYGGAVIRLCGRASKHAYVRTSAQASSQSLTTGSALPVPFGVQRQRRVTAK